MYIVYTHIVSIKVFFGVRHKDLKASPNHQNIRGVKKGIITKFPAKNKTKNKVVYELNGGWTTWLTLWRNWKLSCGSRLNKSILNVFSTIRLKRNGREKNLRYRCLCGKKVFLLCCVGYQRFSSQGNPEAIKQWVTTERVRHKENYRGLCTKAKTWAQQDSAIHVISFCSKKGVKRTVDSTHQIFL